MLRDATEVPDGTTISAEICIIGGGVVGMTLARELRRARMRICVVESGGVDSDPPTQTLADGTTVGDPTNPLATTRQRQLGGSANLWDSHLGPELLGFRCAPLDAIDFEARDAVPESGWPFSREHLDPYYARAQTVCGLGPYAYEADAWTSPAAPLFAVDRQVLRTTVWQFGQQDLFLRAYSAELAQAPDVTVLLKGNVTEIVANRAGTAVTGVRIQTLTGRTFHVAAGIIVMAAGGLENPRLLLLSDSVHRRGLGNEHDLVGRFFMEHPFVLAGRLVPRDRSVFDRAALYDVTVQKGTVVMAKLALTEAVLRRERLLNSGLLLLPTHGMHKPDSIDALKRLLGCAIRGTLPERPGADAREVLSGLDFVGVSILRKLTGRKKLFPFIDWGPGITRGAGWSNLSDRTRRYTVFDAYLLTEQPPLRENRVILGDRRDALGCRRLELHWRWDDLSRRSILRTERLMADAFQRSGFGRLDVRLDREQPFLQYPAQHHHLGTTRMHQDRKRGVVDEHGRVHGLANLFVAGGSVFPTGGYINPTLSIVALTLRLADHLVQTVQRPAAEVGASA